MAPITEEQFVRLVKEMREQQKRFFKAGGRGNVDERKAALILSKKLEAEVDAVVAAALNQNQPTQTGLF